VLVQTGIVLLGLGLLAELLTRIYMDGRHRRIYTVAHSRMQPLHAPPSAPQPTIATPTEVLQ